MLRRGGGAAAILVAVLLACTAGLTTAAPARAGGLLNVPWETLLPPLDDPHHVVEPQRTSFCRTASENCVNTVIRKLDTIRRSFGCDHRAIFALTYERLTQAFKPFIERHVFDDPQRLIYEDALFAKFYFDAVGADRTGAPVPEAWRIAFDANKRLDISGVQDMLLGINAHVQRDMPFVLAGVGLRLADGRSFKPDHDRVNDVLEAAFDPIVNEVAADYDPLTSVLASPLTPLDNVAGLEMVKAWREDVWRNAEALLAAKTDAGRAAVAARIEANAATWARLITSVQYPGYRAYRDAYCAAHLERG
jgi:hypothetical protein